MGVVSKIIKMFKSSFDKEKKKIVILAGTGFYPKIENPDFQNHDYEWNNEKIMNIATRKAFKLGKDKFYDFYTKVRQEYKKKGYGTVHKSLLSLTKEYDVSIITLGIDDSFEKAGFKNVLHVNGIYNQLVCDFKDGGCSKTFKFKSFDKEVVCPRCRNKYSIRPNLCWFGEDPQFDVWQEASKLMENCDLYIQIGANVKDRAVHALVDKCYAEKVEINPKTSDPEEYIFEYVILSTPDEGIKKLKKYIKQYIKGTRQNIRNN